MALVVLVAVGLIAAAFILITSGEDTAPTGRLNTGTSAPLTPSSASVVDPDASVKAEIVAAYRQSYAAFVAVASDPNGMPNDSRLEEHKAGNALLAAQVSIQELRNAGHIYQGTIEVHPTVVELGSDTALVQDCAIDRLSVVDQQSGEVIVPPSTAEGWLATATYRLHDGEWVQNSFTDEKRSCVPPRS